MMLGRNGLVFTLSVGAAMSFASVCGAQDVPAGGYEVHDSTRPQPTVITPGTASTQDAAGKAPSDAVVLFDGKDLSKWVADKDGGEPKWTVTDGAITVVPKTGNLRSKDEFRDVQLHIEFKHPTDVAGKSQGRSNSGVFLMGMYELQVLDNYKSETYADGMVGAVYGQYSPLVNAAREPGQWQSYDVIFRAPRYEGEKVVKPARMTVLLNGVVVQDNVELLGPVKHKGLAEYPKTHPEKGPIKLQEHGNPLSFRNIWVRELKETPPASAKPAAERYKG